MPARSAVTIAEELLSERQAIARVPGRDSEVRAWLRGLGIARRGPTGATVYRWSEIVGAFPLMSEPVQVPATAPLRTTLRDSSRV